MLCKTFFFHRDADDGRFTSPFWNGRLTDVIHNQVIDSQTPWFLRFSVSLWKRSNLVGVGHPRSRSFKSWESCCRCCRSDNLLLHSRQLQATPSNSKQLQTTPGDCKQVHTKQPQATLGNSTQLRDGGKTQHKIIELGTQIFDFS